MHNSQYTLVYPMHFSGDFLTEYGGNYIVLPLPFGLGKCNNEHLKAVRILTVKFKTMTSNML